MTDAVTVTQAWTGVMGDVRGLGKNNTANAGGVKFNFRGIDDVMNAVGPILRERGVAVVPTSADVVVDREVTTSNNKIMRNVTVRVGWSIIGPAGDSIAGMSLGEASDSGDKSVSKAHSVAYRTFLIQALCLPTNEDDPDTYIHDRVPSGPLTNRQKVEAIAQRAGVPSEQALKEFAAEVIQTDRLDYITDEETETLIAAIQKKAGI